MATSNQKDTPCRANHQPVQEFTHHPGIQPLPFNHESLNFPLGIITALTERAIIGKKP
jgi:hypothetical protein